VIVENKEQLVDFIKGYNSEDSIIIPIFCDDNKHPVETEVSLLYIQLMSGKEFILPFNHSETLDIDIPVLKSKFRKYTYDRKKLNHFIKLDNVIDVNFLHYMAVNEPLHIEEIDTNAHHFFNMMYYKKKNINTIIPVLKHLEYCRELATLLRDTIEKYGQYVNVSYNNDVLDDLTHIEHNGLQTTNDVVYSEYNPYTSTGRPSNRFGGINFAALNKSDGSRKLFISRFENGMLVEFDFDGYHLRLIADKVGYEFPEGSVHEHMAKLYGVDYDEAKGLSFQYLYGYIPDEIKKNNEYFNKVSDYINILWDDYKSKEFIVSDIYNKKIYRKNLTEMNANKLFNYTIQLMETENNMKTLSELIPKMKDYKSKLILYSYDSFLFDFNMNDGLDFLYEVKKTIEQQGKFPVKVTKGLNYHEMKNITEKFV
jgi:hypothetical protein